MMRTLVIGDIHGCSIALDALCTLVAPLPQDRLITLGDYVDRGPDSRGVLDRLIARYDAGHLIPLRGNHDQMMVQARDRFDRRMWLGCGGRQTLESYGHAHGDDEYDRIPPRHWRFLEEDCLDWYETEENIFVHASIYPDVPLDEQPTYMLLWEKLEGPILHYSGKVIVCGHTRQLSGVPLDLGSTICIDTGVYDNDGWLTCLHVETGRYWQANQRGQTRWSYLELDGG
jgi:calcineurin-like phosphoesterase family protein